MTPLPTVLASRLESEDALVAWRLDQARFARTWDSGEGAFQVGGRWNSAGVQAVYASLDPAVVILEVAAHAGFRTLDTVPHVLSSLTIADPSLVHVVRPEDLPNQAWIRPGVPGAGQQAFGDALLAANPFVLFPSVTSSHSWNLVFTPARAAGLYALRGQEPFALDTRLHPPVRP
ncbi:RES domain-containing protein [Caulobacter sp. NIBR1757]|uniref:RES family NAD+ phosphorylase n=1 Tax=Caulobacter sp. NIBR1757 TaxID=3016000 RepID=UPI0022F10462|nr:RES domain-containing protein [Caulobacter sp. NIBR1757]WGM37962.1 hypothetical protein AMEJIAPC_00863 [Caulobacter sp. NIBR1757]